MRLGSRSCSLLPGSRSAGEEAVEQETQWGKQKGGPPASSSSSGQVPALPLTALVSGVLLFDAFVMTNSHLLGRADHCKDSESFFFALNSFFLQQSIGLYLYKSWHGHEG